jgi:hypothetical protein
MPVPEGLVSGPPAGGLQDASSDGIINPSEREEVVTMPLYGIIHDSPIITTVQKMTRRGAKNVAASDFVEETQWIDDKLIMPFLTKVVMKIHELEEQAKKK